MSSLKLAIVFSALLIAYCVETEFDIEVEVLENEANVSDASKASAVTDVTKEENTWTSPTNIAQIVFGIVLLMAIIYLIVIEIRAKVLVAKQVGSDLSLNRGSSPLQNL